MLFFERPAGVLFGEVAGAPKSQPHGMVRDGLARYGISRDRTLSGMPPVGRRVTPDLGMGT